MSDNRKKDLSDSKGLQRNGLFGGLTSNDMVTPAWNAINGFDLSDGPLTEDGLNEEEALEEGASYDQSSAEVGEARSEFTAYLASQIDFSSVPDADEISPNSPVDPAAPPTDVVHGTDLINGAGAERDED